MLHEQYTRNILIENPKKIYKNRDIFINSQNSSIDSILDSSSSRNDSAQYIIVPGFINLHAHLAYTELKLNLNAIKELNLFSWIKYLVEYSPKDFDYLASSLSGAREAIATGTTFVVDNSPNLQASLAAYEESGLKGIIGLEIFGSDPTKAQSSIDHLISQVKDIRCPTGVSLAASPHASYDVSPALWKELASVIQSRSDMFEQFLLSHVAESPIEEKWFQDKDHPKTQSARELWTMINTLQPKLANWSESKSSVDYLNKHGLLDLGIKQIFTHMLQANDEDLDLIKTKKISIISCPRSNKLLNNGFPDIDKWLKRQIPTAIATDSKASNHDLDMRKEANQFKHLGAAKRFELITTAAASIIDRNDIGELKPGYQADYAVYRLKSEVNLDAVDPYEIVMDTEIAEVSEVYIAGKLAYQSK